MIGWRGSTKGGIKNIVIHVTAALLLISTAGAFAGGLIVARRGFSVIQVFPFGAIAWGCYLAAHYLETKRLIDSDYQSRELQLPSSQIRIVVTIVGVGIMCLSVPVAIWGLHEISYPITFLATLQMITGFVIAHLASTGSPV